MNIKVLGLITLVAVNAVYASETVERVRKIIEISKSDKVELTKEEKSLIMALQSGFCVAGRELRVRDLDIIARECHHFSLDLMQSIIQSLAKDRNGIALVSPNPNFNIIYPPSWTAWSPLDSAKYKLENNSNAACEQCIEFKKFLDVQREVINIAADKERKELDALLAGK